MKFSKNVGGFHDTLVIVVIIVAAACLAMVALVFHADDGSSLAQRDRAGQPGAFSAQVQPPTLKVYVLVLPSDSVLIPAPRPVSESLISCSAAAVDKLLRSASDKGTQIAEYSRFTDGLAVFAPTAMTDTEGFLFQVTGEFTQSGSAQQLETAYCQGLPQRNPLVSHDWLHSGFRKKLDGTDDQTGMIFYEPISDGVAVLAATYQ